MLIKQLNLCDTSHSKPFTWRLYYIYTIKLLDLKGEAYVWCLAQCFVYDRYLNLNSFPLEYLFYPSHLHPLPPSLFILYLQQGIKTISALNKHGSINQSPVLICSLPIPQCCLRTLLLRSSYNYNLLIKHKLLMTHQNRKFAFVPNIKFLNCTFIGSRNVKPLQMIALLQQMHAFFHSF